ncbi:16S rRNA (guanine(527)-N(7))-methyltransferase RsmG [Hansschlegelia quercus]|uniref:Ribosomal RNA small subunit methyltransferase G n=1 Tax=Hansschlegelia quercus TaxID=2528245 RepID=A0A4Q9GI27_9HYPH|nr:16S rRNA (guanine(527)-N(7))-methyltransferase RsmG [Hansschlegelia quercus]TBN53668.1 16S rRNA (guanine(527)-N(7))-methyltransferase RsmG [Hansschlegelia quercus]
MSREADRQDVKTRFNVPRETLARLDVLVAALDRWQAKTNLVAPSTLPDVWSRHIADSLQLISLVDRKPGDPIVWVDLGSGGGFPGLPVAAALGSACAMHLVESNAKKAAFLREAARAIGVSATIHAARSEDVIGSEIETADIVSARALASLGDLIRLAAPLLKTGAIGLFPKGREASAELTEAEKCWKFQASLHPSLTDADARIVRVERFDGGL